MLKKLFLGASGVLASLVAACEEAPRSVPIVTWPGGVWHFLDTATARAPLPVTVHGLPHSYAGYEEVFDLVAGGTQRAVTSKRISVVDAQSLDATPGIQVVWVLDAPENLNPSRLCDGTPGVDLVGQADPERLRMLAAFCVDGDARAAVRGSVGRGEGRDTKPAARLISQMTRQLINRGEADKD